ncbi:MAG: hypothetical protein ACR2ML_12345, partial [Solirubrobacteraceae bacterium]
MGRLRRAAALLVAASAITALGACRESEPSTKGFPPGAVPPSSSCAALTKAQATAWFAFRPVADATHGPGDALLVRDAKSPSRPYYASRRFEVFRQYSTAAPPGARRLVVRDSLPETSAVAFGFRGRLSVVVTNASRRPQIASLELGSRRGGVSARRTSATQRF